VGHGRERRAGQQPRDHEEAGGLRRGLDGPADLLQEQGPLLRHGRHVGLGHVQPHRRRAPVVRPSGEPGEVLLLRVPGCSGPRAACWSWTSRRTSSSSCAISTPTAGLASPRRR
jgi:hypothetical protein